MAGFDHITIVGVGLIGGSLGLAVRRRGLARTVTGCGHRQSTLAAAQSRGAIDRWTLNLADAVASADLVVLCTPVGLIVPIAAKALPAMKMGAVLTDVASTKAAVTGAVEAILPPGLSFVPAHPMAGSERRGIESAAHDLFAGAKCILTPTRRAPQGAVESVAALWRAVGAHVEFLDPERHDRIVAEISHLPHLLAPVILNAVDSASLPYAATGLRDTTRVAASDVALWIDIFKDNRANLLAALQRFTNELAPVRAALETSDWTALADFLHAARERRLALEPRSPTDRLPKNGG